ncbi:MAG: preprotein translocase subunit SecE [candidate division Zixibacteria bacterium]|nr:preprotein translocase subunit SecE [candidate division Zixibacteria bacterium]
MDKLKLYLNETMGELKKMTWPSKDELVGSTIVVVVVSFVVAIFIGIVDRILVLAMKAIFGGTIGG